MEKIKRKKERPKERGDLGIGKQSLRPPDPFGESPKPGPTSAPSGRSPAGRKASPYCPAEGAAGAGEQYVCTFCS